MLVRGGRLVPWSGSLLALCHAAVVVVGDFIADWINATMTVMLFRSVHRPQITVAAWIAGDCAPLAVYVRIVHVDTCSRESGRGLACVPVVWLCAARGGGVVVPVWHRARGVPLPRGRVGEQMTMSCSVHVA